MKLLLGIAVVTVLVGRVAGFLDFLEGGGGGAGTNCVSNTDGGDDWMPEEECGCGCVCVGSTAKPYVFGCGPPTGGGGGVCYDFFCLKCGKALLCYAQDQIVCDEVVAENGSDHSAWCGVNDNTCAEQPGCTPSASAPVECYVGSPAACDNGEIEVGDENDKCDKGAGNDGEDPAALSNAAIYRYCPNGEGDCTASGTCSDDFVSVTCIVDVDDCDASGKFPGCDEDDKIEGEGEVFFCPF